MNIENKPSVLLVSIDAVNVDLALNPEKHGISLPTISKFIKEGSYASKGVRPVFPSYTYCCHQSIITGTYPSTHGIYANQVFDPIGEHFGAWYWYVSENVPTLWSYAKDNGYLSANVGFPTSVLAETDLNIPEYWRDTTELDSKLLNAASVPQGLAKEAEDKVGRIRCGLWDIEDDLTTLDTCIWLLEDKIKPLIEEKPFFMTTYFASYDDIAHNEGTFGKKPLKYLEKTDEYLGKLIDKAMEITNGNIIICVVSDHGMLDNIGNICPNTIFLKEGLIEVDDKGNIGDWKVWSQRCGGAANIKLKNPEDKELKEKVQKLLDDLVKKYPSIVDALMTGEEAKLNRHGFPDSDFIMTTKPGYEVREDLYGDLITDAPSQKAQHGYSENLRDMQAMFFIKGVGIEKNKELDNFSLVDIAPTLAKLMEFEIETAEGKNIL